MPLLSGTICCEVNSNDGGNMRDGASMKMTFLLYIMRWVAELDTL